MGNKGLEAALAAVEMASLTRALSSQQSAVSEKQVPFGKLRAGSPPRSASRRNDRVKVKGAASKITSAKKKRG
jgi:hypothetical protein